ncbi:MAG: hypothetical protein F4160_14545 [Rhodospirillaceae bacterium]|nr:hypothetical protein [Rhodospirillaceae bacterium]
MAVAMRKASPEYRARCRVAALCVFVAARFMGHPNAAAEKMGAAFVGCAPSTVRTWRYDWGVGDALAAAMAELPAPWHRGPRRRPPKTT